MKRGHVPSLVTEIFATVLAMSAVLSNATAQSATGADAKEIQSLMAKFSDAFNKGDAKQIAATFVQQGCVTDVEGVSITGRDAIQSRYATTFRENPGIQLEIESKSVTVLSPNVAVEEGVAIIQREDPEGNEEAIKVTAPYSAVYVKHDGRWMHAMIRDYFQPADPPSHHERLADLEWMVGEWMEEGPEMVAKSSCTWDDSENFLVWRYQVQDADANAPGGTTYMGWDPRTGQIRSWLFDADGGHGEATWTRISDDEWLVKATGVLADGRTASATQYVKRLAPDRTSWTSFDREVGGESVADISEYVLVRVPPKPGNATQGTGN